MRRILTIVSAVGLFATSSWASIAPPGICCACVEDFVAQTSGPAPPPPETALFCGTLRNDAAQEAFKLKCQSLEGSGVCVAMHAAESQVGEPSLNCAAVLEAEAGIICPAGKAVPVAGQWWLAGLSAALLGAGAAYARRRQREFAPARSA